MIMTADRMSPCSICGHATVDRLGSVCPACRTAWEAEGKPWPQQRAREKRPWPVLANNGGAATDPEIEAEEESPIELGDLPDETGDDRYLPPTARSRIWEEIEYPRDWVGRRPRKRGRVRTREDER